MDGLNDSCFLLESATYNEKDCSGGWTCWYYNYKKRDKKNPDPFRSYSS